VTPWIELSETPVRLSRSPKPLGVIEPVKVDGLSSCSVPLPPPVNDTFCAAWLASCRVVDATICKVPLPPIGPPRPTGLPKLKSDAVTTPLLVIGALM
jgi:hypothetical protein